MTSPNKKPLIELSQLSFSFSSKEPLLKDVSFSIHPGEFLAIIGPNGSGKSTLLKLILGELVPKKGKITRQPDLKVSYVPQSLIFDPHFPITALEVVMGGLFNQKERKQTALSMLKQLEMDTCKDHLFGSLSGGQAQRVLIARALVSNPTLLLLDEPTASVDLKTERTIIDLISSQKEHCATLMVTHHLQTVLQAVDGILSVQQQTTYMKPKEVCEHFALGLYHTPLIETDPTHFINHSAAR